MSAVRATLRKARIGMVPPGASTSAQLLRARTFSSAPDDMLLATPAPEASNPRQGHGAFDTYRFVTELERAGVPKGQAVMIMEQVLLAISEANTRQIALVATKQDLLSLQSEINEKVYSSTLRYDLAQRHLKELMQRDLMQVKADVRSEEKFDFAKLHDEITELEKRVFQRRETDEVRFTQVHTEIAALERRVILQYGIGFFGSVIAMGLAVARIAALQ
ncbi:unnamed protein product [Ectocarpus sp. CCAP 1310/34]|nr:unnamed protein product [Ectocarpus sp. CCAP 1310/34]